MIEKMEIRILEGKENEGDPKATRLLIDAIVARDHLRAAIAFQIGANRHLTTNFTVDDDYLAATDRDIIFETLMNSRDVDFCKLLIDNGLYNPHHFTPLHIALIVATNLNDAEYYIDKKVINQATKRGNTAIHHLIIRSVELIIEEEKRRVSDTKKIIIDSIYMLRLMIDNGADVNAQPTIEYSKNKRQQSPLRRLISHSRVNNSINELCCTLCRELLSAGAGMKESNRRTSICEYSHKHGSKEISEIICTTLK